MPRSSPTSAMSSPKSSQPPRRSTRLSTKPSSLDDFHCPPVKLSKAACNSTRPDPKLLPTKSHQVELIATCRCSRAPLVLIHFLGNTVHPNRWVRLSELDHFVKDQDLPPIPCSTSTMPVCPPRTILPPRAPLKISGPPLVRPVQLQLPRLGMSPRPSEIPQVSAHRHLVPQESPIVQMPSLHFQSDPDPDQDPRLHHKIPNPSRALLFLSSLVPPPPRAPVPLGRSASPDSQPALVSEGVGSVGCVGEQEVGVWGDGEVGEASRGGDVDEYGSSCSFSEEESGGDDFRRLDQAALLPDPALSLSLRQLKQLSPINPFLEVPSMEEFLPTFISHLDLSMSHSFGANFWKSKRAGAWRDVRSDVTASLQVALDDPTRSKIFKRATISSLPPQGFSSLLSLFGPNPSPRLKISTLIRPTLSQRQSLSPKVRPPKPLGFSLDLVLPPTPMSNSYGLLPCSLIVRNPC